MSEPTAQVTVPVAQPLIVSAESPPTESPASTRAFGLPDGTVRAMLALLVIGGDMFMNCYYKWAPPNLDTMATVAFTFYFVGAVAKAVRP